MLGTRGLKMFGQKAINALAKEWKQLDTLSVFEDREYYSLAKKERHSALRTAQLIKQKKDETIKGRTRDSGSQ